MSDLSKRIKNYPYGKNELMKSYYLFIDGRSMRESAKSKAAAEWLMVVVLTPLKRDRDVWS